MEAIRVVVAFAFMGGIVAACGADDDGATSGSFVRSTVFTAGEEGVDTYRIPGALVSERGTLVVFAEARVVSPLDHDPHLLVARRSTDRGRTWSANIPVAPLDVPEAGCYPSDPVPVVVRRGTERGTLLVVFRPCRFGTFPLRIARSMDDGRTWSIPEELDIDYGDALPEGFRLGGLPGPAHGIELREGEHAGRLVIVVTSREYSILLLSDDGGRHWRVGAVAEVPDSRTVDIGESTVAELADGSLLVSSRNGAAASNARVQLRSFDAGESYAAGDDGDFIELATELTIPEVEGTLLTLPADGRIVFASPSDRLYRRGVRLWFSPDGRDWQPGPLVVPHVGAYTDLVALEDAEPPSIGVIVETGDRHPYQRIDFVPVPITALDEPAPILPEEFDAPAAAAGRLIVAGQRYEVTRHCFRVLPPGQRVELDGGWLEFSGLGVAGVEVHVDDRGDGTSLDLNGDLEVSTRAGVSIRGDLFNGSGAPWAIDFVLVNSELCRN